MCVATSGGPSTSRYGRLFRALKDDGNAIFDPFEPF